MPPRYLHESVPLWACIYVCSVFACVCVLFRYARIVYGAVRVRGRKRVRKKKKTAPIDGFTAFTGRSDFYDRSRDRVLSRGTKKEKKRKEEKGNAEVRLKSVVSTSRLAENGRKTVESVAFLFNLRLDGFSNVPLTRNASKYECRKLSAAWNRLLDPRLHTRSWKKKQVEHFHKPSNKSGIEDFLVSITESGRATCK